jgi:cytochrome c oxidase assembly protein subunit 11
MSQNTDELARKNKRMATAVFSTVIGMLALAFACVPLYDMFCRVTGWGGTTQVARQAPDNVSEREVIVQFNTDTDRGLPWRFSSEKDEIRVNVGQDALVTFKARNKTARKVAGTAIYNVTPPKVGKYFNKTQCFCFNKTVLQPGQKATMPVVFFIDPEFADDEDMEDVKVITLNYKFYPTESNAFEEATQAFYNDTRNVVN